MKSAIITVHGVGDSSPGSTIRTLSGVLDDSGAFSHADLVLKGTSYSGLEGTGPDAADLYEMNWSDVQRAPTSLIGVLEWLLRLTLALVNVRFDWLDEYRVPKGLPAYLVLIQCFLIWSIYPVLLSAVHYWLADTRSILLGEGLISGFAAFTASKMSGWGNGIRRAGIIAVLILFGFGWALHAGPDAREELTIAAIRFYGLSQIAAVVLLSLITVEQNFRIFRKPARWRAFLSQIACAEMSLVLLSALGSALVAVTLNALSGIGGSTEQRQSVERWQALFLEHLGYQLAPVEFATAGATAALALIAVFGLVVYFLTPKSRRGTFAHLWAGIVIYSTPWLLLVPGTLIYLTSPYFGAVLHMSPTIDVLDVYTWSALRVAPWLLLFMTPVATVLDVLGDVVFYIADPDRSSAIGSRKLCRERLSTLLLHLQARYDRVYILAHSQGSVVAHDVVSAEQSRVVLITLGSPLRSLYGTYLQWRLMQPFEGLEWRNYFRNGDYIGGRVGYGQVDVSLGTGGHVNYWSDPRLMDRVRNLLRTRSKGDAIQSASKTL